MITTLLLSLALAQEPTPAPAAEAAPATAAAAPAKAAPAAADGTAAPAADAAAAPAVDGAAVPAVEEPKTDAEAVAQTEQAIDAFAAGKWGGGLLLLAGVVWYAIKRFKGKKAEAPKAE